MSADLTVTVPTTKQVLVYFAGTGSAWMLHDESRYDTSEMSSVERAVLVSRLRAHADIIESQANVS